MQASKSSIKHLFKDILNEIKGFKYQITLAVLLSKVKNYRSIEYSPVYFNSTTKTVINSKFSLDKSFQEIFHRINNWINEGSGWMIKLIERFYLNISTYSPLVRSTYIEFPDELRNSLKGLINIKNSESKCFLWCHVRYLNLIDKNLQRITKEDKELISKLNYERTNFPISKKDYSKTKMQNKICISVFCYDNKLT